MRITANREPRFKTPKPEVVLMLVPNDALESRQNLSLRLVLLLPTTRGMIELGSRHQEFANMTSLQDPSQMRKYTPMFLALSTISRLTPIFAQRNADFE